MKRILALLLLAALCASNAFAKPTVDILLAKDENSKPTTTFAPDVPKLYAFFKSKGTKKADKLRGVWIAEDVGDAAPKDTKIDQAVLDGDSDNFFGAFSMTKPTKGWPVGKYRIEVYAGEDLVATAKFTIKDEQAN